MQTRPDGADHSIWSSGWASPLLAALLLALAATAPAVAPLTFPLRVAFSRRGLLLTVAAATALTAGGWYGLPYVVPAPLALAKGAVSHGSEGSRDIVGEHHDVILADQLVVLRVAKAAIVKRSVRHKDTRKKYGIKDSATTEASPGDIEITGIHLGNRLLEGLFVYLDIKPQSSA